MENIISDRKKKIEILVKEGINPYPSHIKRTHNIGDAVKSFANLVKNKKNVIVVGRIKSARNQGNIIFVDLEDFFDDFFFFDFLADAFWLIFLWSVIVAPLHLHYLASDLMSNPKNQHC